MADTIAKDQVVNPAVVNELKDQLAKAQVKLGEANAKIDELSAKLAAAQAPKAAAKLTGTYAVIDGKRYDVALQGRAKDVFEDHYKKRTIFEDAHTLILG